MPEDAAYHLHEGTEIQSQGHENENEVGIVHFVGYETGAVIEPYGICANDVDERYAPYPTQFEEVACREHEDYGEDVDHEIQIGYTFLVLPNVDKYLTWIVVEAVNSIPMAEHEDDRYVS